MHSMWTTGCDGASVTLTKATGPHVGQVIQLCFIIRGLLELRLRQDIHSSAGVPMPTKRCSPDSITWVCFLPVGHQNTSPSTCLGDILVRRLNRRSCSFQCEEAAHAESLINYQTGSKHSPPSEEAHFHCFPSLLPSVSMLSSLFPTAASTSLYWLITPQTRKRAHCT